VAATSSQVFSVLILAIGHSCGGNFLRLVFHDATTGVAGAGQKTKQPLKLEQLEKSTVYIYLQSGSLLWSCLDPKIFLEKNSCITFVVIWQILSNHGLIRLKRFILTFTGKLCEWLFFLPTFNVSCMRPKIRYDGYCIIFFGCFGELNMTFVYLWLQAYRVLTCPCR
jgi:hypothetical protein